MNPRPIPRCLMPSTATVWVPVEGDYGGEFAEEPQAIAHVRFDRYVGMNRMQYVETDGAQGRLYVDAKSSDGAFAIPVGSMVAIDGGQKMEALRVNRFEDFNGNTHHWEIDLR